MNCKDLEPILGCLTREDGTTESVVIHYTYGTNAAGVEIIKSVRYTSANGQIVTVGTTDLVTPGDCKCDTECVTGGVGGFDVTDTLFRCSKIGFTLDNAFTSLCPDGWTPQELVDRLNEGNPTGTVFEVVSGNIIGVVSGEVPELLQFFHSGGGQTTIYPSEGGETVCATRVKDCNSDRQTELLQEIADNTCPTDVTSNVVCSDSAQTVDLVNGGTASLTAGQELLLGEVYDCKGNLQSFSLSVLLAGVLQEIDSPVDTGVCPTPPETPVPSGCVKDANGQEWNVFTTSLNGDSVTYYQDAITGKIGTPAGDSSSWTTCGDDTCCPEVKEHYLCVDGVKTPVWVSLYPDTLTVNKVVDTLTLQTLDESLYQNGFLTPCGTCELIANLRCESYGDAFASNYQNWTDAGDYDGLQDEFGIVPCGTPRENYLRIIEYKVDGVDRLSTLPQTVFGGYALSPTALDTAFDDVNTALSSEALNIIPNAGTQGYIYEVDSNARLTIVLQEGFDDCAGGVNWAGSAFGIVVRGGVTGDFIVSGGVGSSSNFDDDEIGDFDTYQDSQNCTPI